MRLSQDFQKLFSSWCEKECADMAQKIQFPISPSPALSCKKKKKKSCPDLNDLQTLKKKSQLRPVPHVQYNSGFVPRVVTHGQLCSAVVCFDCMCSNQLLFERNIHLTVTLESIGRDRLTLGLDTHTHTHAYPLTSYLCLADHWLLIRYRG